MCFCYSSIFVVMTVGLILIIFNLLMKDEERQTTFKGQYKQFSILLGMSNDILSIVVENSENLERFSKTINQDYISQQLISFQGAFEEVQDIMDYLITCFEEIVVQGSILKINYPSGVKKRVKTAEIKLKGEEMSCVDLAVHQLQKQRQQQLTQCFNLLDLSSPHQRDTTINELGEKVKTFEENYRALQKKYRSLSEEFQISSEKNQAAIMTLRGELQLERSKSNQLTQQMEKLSIQMKSQKQIGHHSNNSHAKYYDLECSSSTLAKITRIEENGWYNFVNKCEILPNLKAKYSFTLKKTKDTSIMVGFCTEEGLGITENYIHAGSAYLYCWDIGYLYEGGSYKQATGGCGTGEKIECVADLMSQKLSWWKEGIQIAECKVPAEMKGKPIYISIIIYESGDEFDLCIYH